MSAAVDELVVSGGVAGVTAVVQDVHGCGTALLAAAAAVAAVAPGLARLAADPVLGVAAVLDPTGAGRVLGAVADCVAGPSGLVAAATGCAGVGVAAHLAAEVYRVAEADAGRAVSSVRQSLARGAVPRLAPVLLPVAVAAVGLSVAGWVVVRAAPVVREAAVRAAGLAVRGELDPQAAASLAHGVVEEVRGRLGDDAVALAQVVQVQAARHPEVVREVLSTLPVAVGSVVPDVVERLLLGGPGQGRGGAGLDTVPELAALLALAGAADGRLRQGEVRAVPVGPPRRDTGARDVAGLLARLRSYAPPVVGEPPREVTPGRVRVDRVEGAGGPRWVVYVPPTQTWSTGGGPLPADGTANLRLVAGLENDAVEAAREAMVAAGVRPGEPVLAVGYSQGGMTAAALAADPHPVGDVQAVLTAGSPVSHVPLPARVQALSLEDADDLTPDLDGAVDPDRRGWTSVEHRRPVDPRDPWAGHAFGAYLQTAQLVDASDHPSVLAWREAVAPFLDPRAEVVTQEISTLRERP